MEVVWFSISLRHTALLCLLPGASAAGAEFTASGWLVLAAAELCPRVQPAIAGHTAAPDREETVPPCRLHAVLMRACLLPPANPIAERSRLKGRCGRSSWLRWRRWNWGWSTACRTARCPSR